MFWDLSSCSVFWDPLPRLPRREPTRRRRLDQKCVNDNKREGATPEVVAAYCSCMNGKMSSDETLSVTAWEKTHPTEMAACDKESGWK